MSALSIPIKAWVPGGLCALPIVLGWLVLYGPTYANLSQTLWQTDEQAHAPLIGLVAMCLLWHLRERLLALPDAPQVVAGGLTIATGLLLALLGHSLDMSFLSMLSQIPVLAGILLLLRGTAALKLAWFPVAFLLFMIPLPGILIDSLTGHLKVGVSTLTEALLYELGYPIARSGVIIAIGPYQMLVVDACSGLHSMVSLSAMGLLFTHLMQRHSRLHNTVLVASILPIAFFANLVRVTLLVLLTYHQGDSMGRLLHGLMGVSVFIIALCLLFALDAALARPCQALSQALSERESS